MDRILLQNLVFRGNHGVLPEETSLGQRFEVDVCLHADLRSAGVSDDVSQTVNYAEVYERVRRVVTEQPRQLIEAVAEAIAAAVLADFARVARVDVTVRKPAAPIPGVFDSVAVTLNRERA
ncbi:MAG: dihydroneopterin aldolase [Opitutales bacterium]